jgi:hypothetical protein
MLLYDGESRRRVCFLLEVECFKATRTDSLSRRSCWHIASASLNASRGVSAYSRQIIRGPSLVFHRL